MCSFPKSSAEGHRRLLMGGVMSPPPPLAVVIKRKRKQTYCLEFREAVLENLVQGEQEHSFLERQLSLPGGIEV